MADELNYEEIMKDLEPSVSEVKSVEDELEIPKVEVNVNIEYQKVESKGDKEDYKDDAQYVRGTLLRTIGKADRILESLMKKIVSADELMNIEEESFSKPQARYYEISSTLVKSICDASKELLNLHATNSKIKHENEWELKKEDTKDEANVTMSTQDLIRQIRESNFENQSIS